MSLHLQPKTYTLPEGQGAIDKPNTRAEREKKRAETRAGNQKLRKQAEQAAGVDPERRVPIDALTKREVMKAGCCAQCGAKASDGIKLVIDHIRPVASFPPGDHSYNQIENLRLLCEEHNALKGAARDFEAEKKAREAYEWRTAEHAKLLEKLDALKPRGKAR